MIEGIISASHAPSDEACASRTVCRTFYTVVVAIVVETVCTYNSKLEAFTVVPVLMRRTATGTVGLIEKVRIDVPQRVCTVVCIHDHRLILTDVAKTGDCIAHRAMFSTRIALISTVVIVARSTVDVVLTHAFIVYEPVIVSTLAAATCDYH